MKKVFKSLMVGALAIPCAFAFTGCGDNSVSVDIGGNYKNVEATTAYTEISNLVENGTLGFKGIKFTLKSNLKSDEMTTESTLNGTAVYTDSGIELAITINGKGVVAGVNADMNMSMYVHENVLYVQSGNQKFKIDMSSEQSGTEQFLQYINMVPNNKMLEQSLETLKSNITLSEKAEAGDVVKYHVKGESQTSGNNEFWYVIKDGKFDGFKANSEVVMEDTTMTGSVNVISYTGTVDMPSFDGYVDFNSLLGM